MSVESILEVDSEFRPPVTSGTTAPSLGLGSQRANDITGSPEYWDGTQWQPVTNALVVESFGAVGDANHYSAGSFFVTSTVSGTGAILSHDDTAAIQAAINAAVATGKDLLFSQKNYQITSTLTIPGSPFGNDGSRARALHMIGQGTGGYTYLKFNPDTSDPAYIANANMFTVADNMSYMIFENLAFRDESATATKCTYSFTTTRAATGVFPLWKVEYRNFRFENFNVGLHFEGDTDYLKDALLDGFTFTHGKFRECKTSVIYENTQAVNHTYLNVDFENTTDTDSDTEKDPTLPLGSLSSSDTGYKIFHFKRGSMVNHFGGSVIGAGSYVFIEVLASGHFQATSQFNSYGVRMEQRSSNEAIIHHSDTSTINGANSFKVNLDGFSVVNSYTGVEEPVFAKLGGQIALTCNNVRTNKEMFVEAYITPFLVSNFQLGNIDIRNSNKLTYRKITPKCAYQQTTAVASTDQTEIPARIVNKVEGISFTNTNGVLAATNTDTQVLAAGFTPTELKQFVYKPSSSTGFSGTTISLQLPLYARPVKFGLVKTSANASAPIVMTFNIETGTAPSVVEHQCAQIDTTNFAGAAEQLLTLPASSINELYVDGSNWDGRCTIVKSGSTAAFQGILIIYYI
jgi:hypothetical protein